MPKPHPVIQKSVFRHYTDLVRTVWLYAGNWRKVVVLNYFIFFLANLAISFQPYVIGELVNVLQTGGDNLLHDTIKWLSFYVAVALIFWLFHGPGRVLEWRLAFRVQRSFYNEAYHRLTRLPLSWHHDHHSGNIINRISKSARALNDFAGGHFIYLETTFRYFLTLTFMAFLSWPVALFMLVFSWALFLMLRGFDRRIMREIHLLNEKTHNFSARLFDYTNNMISVIALTIGRRSQKHLDDIQDEIYPHIRNKSLLIEFKWCLMMIGISAMYFAVLGGYIGWHLKMDKTIMLGTLVAIFQYMARMDIVYFRVAELYQKIAQLNTDAAAADTIQQDYEAFGIEDADRAELQVTRGAIEFRDIGFSYIKDRPVFENFNLTIAPGEKIGVVGLSGAGKSTLVQLLLRFYQPQSGCILIDDQDIQGINTESLRRNIALIPQDISLFESSLYKNIHIARLEATKDEVEQAAQRAGAHEFIKKMPQGYDTLVGERGVKLSGGQRQRVAIARAFLKASPILILDEATSALDSVTEQSIQTVLGSVMDGRTVIVIAHRLSTLRSMDRVVVLDHGKILEQGSHDDLLSMNGAYARLWAMQAGGFLRESLEEEGV